MLVEKNDTKEILALKSAFSIVDQIFIQEIENAEIQKKNWFRRIFCFSSSLPIKDPLTLNKFINGIMDPFKDADETQTTDYKLEKLKNSNARQKTTTVCWPFCYSVPKMSENKGTQFNSDVNNKKHSGCRNDYYNSNFILVC